MTAVGNNNRIAKNTMLLYFRMLLTMAVSLYTVKVLLLTLGSVDYGIYSVVGGVVLMFTFISNSMASASQRFFAFELGRNDPEQLRKTFSQTVIIYFIISVIVLIFAETIGLWFLNHKMVIPADRMYAANWVYQFSIVSFVTTIITIPYNGAIIAHENMKVFAYVSIVEVLLKLVIVYLLVYFLIDKLILYAILMFVATLIVTFVYRTICMRRYPECKLRIMWDKHLFKTLVGYSGWNMFGAVALALNNYGLNILLNIFCGPIVNAARALAFQVSIALNQFVMNFHTAVRPQITNLYAKGEKDEMLSLVYRGSKYSYLLLAMLSMPVLLETKYFLTLWLHVVPDYIVIFTQLAIINVLIDSMTYSLQTAAQATGKIKYYQIFVGGLLMMNLPVSYIFLSYGYKPYAAFVISIVISFICLLVRLKFLNSLIQLIYKDFLKLVFLPNLYVTICALGVPLLITFFVHESTLRFLIVGVLSVITTLVSIYLLGLTTRERLYFGNEIKRRIKFGK